MRRIPMGWRKHIEDGTAIGKRALMALSDVNEPARGNAPHIPHSRPREQVGTALAARISAILSIKAGKGCGCKNFADEMNKWGIAGCEQRREEIVARLVSQRESLATALMTQGYSMATVGWALKLRIVPDIVLRAGASWLLTKAMEDVRAMPQQRSNRPAASLRMIPLIGKPIDRSRLKSHLLYHIMPLTGAGEAVWRRHCRWIREVRPLYNGRLIIGIVTPGLEDQFQYCSVEAVKEALSGLDAEYIIAPNDTGKRKARKPARQGKGEGVLFPQMLESVMTTDPDQIAVYGHCKGVTRPEDAVPQKWSEVMFETVIKNHTAVVNALDSHGLCCSLRMNGGLPNGAGIGQFWFPSGTVFGVRLADVAARNWRKLPSHYGCVEQWPRLNFEQYTQTACLFLDGVQNLYDAAYWAETVTPAFEKWKQEHGTH